MIRINLLGQARPKATAQAVPLEATMQIIFLVAALALAAVVLGVTYFQQKRQLDETNERIQSLQAEKANLEQIKAEVDSFERQKAVLQQRIDVIEDLQRNRSGAQDLLQMVANTTVRVDAVWLTSMTKTGTSLELDGEAGSIDAVANYITELKRSGYFDQIEIKTAKEDDIVPAVQTYNFSMTLAIAGPGGAKTQVTGAAQGAPPAPRGRS
jgi:Tfp pilus assembly protein PilN